MKLSTVAALSSIVLACGLAAAQGSSHRTEITSVDIPSLVGKKAADLSVGGLHLGMTRPEAEAVLAQSKTFKAVYEEFFPDRIYVYPRTTSGPKTDSLLCLAWEEEMREEDEEPRTSRDLRNITVFKDFRAFLQPNFAKMLTLEAVDQKSAFAKRFLGVPSRTKEIVDPASIGGRKHTTYFYDEIGIAVTREQSPKGDYVVFQLENRSR